MVEASCATIEESLPFERIRRLAEQLRHRPGRLLRQLREAISRLLADSDRGAHHGLSSAARRPTFRYAGANCALARVIHGFSVARLVQRDRAEVDASILVGANQSILGMSLYPDRALLEAMHFLRTTSAPADELVRAVTLAQVDEAMLAADTLQRRGRSRTRRRGARSSSELAQYLSRLTRRSAQGAGFARGRCPLGPPTRRADRSLLRRDRSRRHSAARTVLPPRPPRLSAGPGS